MKKGYKALLAEAEAEVETVPVEQALSLHGQDGVVFVDLRDPREIQREGPDTRVLPLPPGHARGLGRSGEPLCEAGLHRAKALPPLLRQRLALGTCREDVAGHGPSERGACRRRLHGMEER